MAADASRRGVSRSSARSTPSRPGSGWGTVDVDDVLAVLDAALSRYPFCDADRVGMLGGSYGGYMATWLAGCHGERFKAICSERAVNNMITEEFSSDIATVFRVEVGPSPLDDPDEYIRISPIRFVRDIDVPMLIIHSENDFRCPIGQAEELFVAMRLLGKDVTFYRFPGEGHELSRTGSPIHRRDARRDHPRLLRREAGSSPQAPRRGYGEGDPDPLEISPTHASISLRAIEIGGGIVGSSSRRYHRASTISTGSISISPDSTPAMNPTIRLCGNGHGWLPQ